MSAPAWVTVEGINGVGKTHLTTRLAQRLAGRCRLLTEVTDPCGGPMPRRVVHALTRPGATMLRTGHPLTETFALLALKVREYERVRADPSEVPLVLEDRGVDTVAVYQAAILTEGCPSEQATGLVGAIHDAASLFRPLPDLTLLLVDDFHSCLRRFAQRRAEPVSARDQALLRRISGLYADLAATYPARVRIVDRAGRCEAEVLAEMHAHCTVLLTEETH